MIRVMLVDDQARELEGMRSIIRWEEMDMQVVQAAADARDALLVRSGSVLPPCGEALREGAGKASFRIGTG